MAWKDNPGMCNPPKIAHVPGLLTARFVIEDCKIQTEAQAREALATLGDKLTVEKLEAKYGVLHVMVPVDDDPQSWIDRIHAAGFIFCCDPSTR